MDYARRTVSRHGMPRVRDWPVATLPKPLLALLAVVTCGYLSWIGVDAASLDFRPDGLALFAALVGCVAVSVEMARRASEPAGVVKDVYAVWELPVVILLPGLYALLIPAIRLALTQRRVRRAPAYRRVCTAAAIGIGYGCAGLVYRGILPAGWDPRAYLWSHTVMWLVAAGAGAITQWLVNQVLILGAVKLADPRTRITDQLLSVQALHNDATELCAALLVAVGMTISGLTLIIALPLTTLLQRSVRHAQLLSEARADAKTGLLNAATWEREATAEVARAVRGSSPLAVALLDLDRFKQINDTHGHLLGDEVLRQIAAAMTGVLRDYDLAGRFGGEEFVMLLPRTRAPDAFRIADRVREHIARLPIRAADGGRIDVTVSIGVAALDAGSNRGLTELLAAADAALYRAKDSGRNQVQMISTSRGLSAVRSPAGELDLDAGSLWRPAKHRAGDRAEGGQATVVGQSAVGQSAVGQSAVGQSAVGQSAAARRRSGTGLRVVAGRRADAAPAPEGLADGAAQLPDDGSASTATTSAFAL